MALLRPKLFSKIEYKYLKFTYICNYTKQFKVLKMRNITKGIIVFILALSISSCATILGGPVSQSQKTKPLPGQQQRQIKVGWFIADFVLFLPGLAVDFATGAIYRPN